ncbi:MAG: carbon starvation protein A [Campylobacterales bacterium]|nr:carbon starvation protein A [Campylobacterales bacterium]
MITFLCCIALLFGAYFTYGKFVEKTFGMDAHRPTPASTQADGVDFVPMSTSRVYLIQFLNIAGLGPIFGPILGALYGPVAFVWIVLGAIFAGGVHDYMAGMMSVRNKGKSLPELTGAYLGNTSRYAMLVVSVLLLLFVGVVFIVGPAALMANLTFETGGESIFTGTPFENKAVWVVIIFAYYLISTVFPINKIIGKFYPFFGFVLMFMAVGVGGSMIYHGLAIPELTSWADFSHPRGTPIWPGLFFTISCGALSGFHATQSPLMARTLTNESKGRVVFYGAMLTEGVVAMIWAAAGMAYFPEGITGLNEVLTKGGPGLVVNQIAIGYLGIFGGLLAILGVIAAPITSGDTAFRAIRLTISDRFNIGQVDLKNRLMVSVPIFVVAFFITQVNFAVIWQYFTFSNQMLAAFSLWTAVAYLYQHGRNFWMAGLPGALLTGTLVGYVLTAKEFPFNAGQDIASMCATVTSIAILLYLANLSLNARKRARALA